jgi:hypothetical protein
MERRTAMMSMESAHGYHNDSKRPVGWIPCHNAEVIVTVDGKPYAGFINRAYAEMAVGLWSGTLSASGLPIDVHEHTKPGWPAARGRCLAIVERGNGR